MDLLKTSAIEIRDAVRAKQISAVEVYRFFWDRCQKLNPELNAFISFNENAFEEAKAIDAKIANGEEPGELAGVPVAVKDLLNKKATKTTAGSKILETYTSPYSCTVVERLEAAGAVILGKTNLDEFAMGSSNETSYYGKVKNPWKPDYVPGGSSGGSAAAVAAKMVLATIGTDTGGSIRQPANFSGVYGIKPTYGRVSRFGIIAFASSLDQAGPMANCLEDTALVLKVISGKDIKDNTSSSLKVPSWDSDMDSNVSGLRIGLPKEYFSDAVDVEVRQAVEEAIHNLKKQGAEFIDVSLPNTEYAVPTYYIIATSEASSNLARYDGVRYAYRAEAKNLDDLYKKTRGTGFGEEVKRRIMLGTYTLSSGYYDAYYKKALKVRKVLQQDFNKAFEDVDVLLSPVTTSPAFKIDERISDPLEMYTNDIFTTSTNLAGLPGMSAPLKLSKNGLPIGVQLTAKHFEEDKIFNVAKALENLNTVKGSTPYVY